MGELRETKFGEIITVSLETWLGFGRRVSIDFRKRAILDW
jgi:hypothetical protein